MWELKKIEFFFCFPMQVWECKCFLGFIPLICNSIFQFIRIDVCRLFTEQHYLKLSIVRYWFCIYVVYFCKYFVSLCHTKKLHWGKRTEYEFNLFSDVFFLLLAYFYVLSVCQFKSSNLIFTWLIFVVFVNSFLHHLYFSLFNKMASIAYTL